MAQKSFHLPWLPYRSGGGNPVGSAPFDVRPSVPCPRGQGGATVVIAGLVWLASLAGVIASDGISIELIDHQDLSATAIGFGGQYKVGHWTPVRLQLKTGAAACRGHIVLKTHDSDGQSVEFVQQEEVSLAANEERSVVGYIRFGSLESQLSVGFQTDQDRVTRVYQRVSDLATARRSTDPLVVVLGGELPPVTTPIQAGPTKLSYAAVAAAEMPDRWHGYEAVDTLILLTGQLSAFDGVTQPQWSALDRWVQLGGRLVLSVGRNGAAVFDSQHPLARFNPGQFVGVRQQAETAELESIFASSEQLSVFDMTAIRNPQGVVEVSIARGNEQQAFWVRFARGMGQVDLIAADLGLSPWTSWSGRISLMPRLIDGLSAGRPRRGLDMRVEKLAHVGYRDIVGQLRGAMDQFENVRIFPFGLVAALITLYALLIGPGDFFMLRRWLALRMQWTWLTFPLLAILFCLLAIGLSRYRDQGQVVVNKVEIIDVDTQSGRVRGTTWAQLYSPRQAQYDLSLTPSGRLTTDENAEVLMCWQGLPGDGLGGLGSPSTNRLTGKAYEVSFRSGGQLRGLSVPVASSKSLSVRWSAKVSAGSESQLVADRRHFLRGEIQNPLNVDLVDAVVLYQNSSYMIDGVLRSGQVVSLNQLSHKDLRWKLQQRVVVSNRDVSTQWDPEDVRPGHVPRILELMMFYGAAGGESYVDLTHRYQSYVDLSAALRTGRAILLGRCHESLSDLSDQQKLLSADANAHWTYVRVLFPVEMQQP